MASLSTNSKAEPRASPIAAPYRQPAMRSARVTRPSVLRGRHRARAGRRHRRRCGRFSGVNVQPVRVRRATTSHSRERPGRRRRRVASRGFKPASVRRVFEARGAGWVAGSRCARRCRRRTNDSTGEWKAPAARTRGSAPEPLPLEAVAIRKRSPARESGRKMASGRRVPAIWHSSASRLSQGLLRDGGGG